MNIYSAFLEKYTYFMLCEKLQIIFPIKKIVAYIT